MNYEVGDLFKSEYAFLKNTPSLLRIIHKTTKTIWTIEYSLVSHENWYEVKWLNKEFKTLIQDDSYEKIN